MSAAPFLVALVVVALVAGWPAAALLSRRQPHPFAALALGLALLGWLALVAAEVGRFSDVTLVVLWGGASLLLLLVATRRGRLRWRPSGWPPLLYLAWLPIAAGLFLRPHAFVHGGADAGVYVNLAASIVRTGGIVVADPLLADLPVSLYPSLLRPLPAGDYAPFYILPGFYVLNETPGQIVPQFYPLHPVWQAVAYRLGGIGAALSLTGLWALLGATAVYLAARRLVGRVGAVVVLGALTLSALQLWFARYPTTEMLNQFWLWTGVWALLRWLDDDAGDPLWPMLAGVALGLTLLVRIDAFVIWLIPAGLVAWRVVGPSRRLGRDDLVFLLPLLALSGHTLAHALLQSRPYFFNTYGFGLQVASRAWPLWVGGAGAVAVAGVWLRRRAGLAGLASAERPLRRLAVVVLLLLTVYAAFVRPNLGELATRVNWYDAQVLARADHLNVPRLAWYLSPLGLLLATLGSAHLLWRWRPRTAVFLAAGLPHAFLYLWRIAATPTQPYSMRRYVPAVLPFALIAAVYALVWLWGVAGRRRVWQTVVALLAVIWLAGLAGRARGFASQVDYADLPAQLAALNDHFAPGSIILIGDAAPVGIGDFLGTPLRFLYGHDVYVLRDTGALDAAALENALDNWHSAGRRLYWVAVPGAPAWPVPGWPAEPVAAFTVTTAALEGPIDRRPTAVLPIEWPTLIHTIESP